MRVFHRSIVALAWVGGLASCSDQPTENRPTTVDIAVNLDTYHSYTFCVDANGMYNMYCPASYPINENRNAKIVVIAADSVHLILDGADWGDGNLTTDAS